MDVIFIDHKELIINKLIVNDKDMFFFGNENNFILYK